MGEHLRSAWRALKEVGIDAQIVDIFGPRGPLDPDYSAPIAGALTEQLGHGVNIFCINGDEVERAFAALRHARPMEPGSRNIVYPAWELEQYPAEWARQLERFDEVWAPSKFTRNAIAEAVSIPVVHMPLACEARRRALRSRRYFGIRESAYAFFFAFDFLSYVERKNPFALIDAFHTLLKERPFDDITLVVKTNNSHQRPEMKRRFEAAIEPLREHIVVIDETLSDVEMKGLVWLIDCFVSMHRSEGFGFGLAEAMYFGKPVIATAYSGNMDFCTEETARLVPYDLIPLKRGDYPFWEGQYWADPDVGVATRAMRDLIDDPQAGRALGESARVNLMENFSYLAVGVTYLSHLKEPQ